MLFANKFYDDFKYLDISILIFRVLFPPEQTIFLLQLPPGLG